MNSEERLVACFLNWLESDPHSPYTPEVAAGWQIRVFGSAAAALASRAGEHPPDSRQQRQWQERVDRILMREAAAVAAGEQGE